MPLRCWEKKGKKMLQKVNAKWKDYYALLACCCCCCCSALFCCCCCSLLPPPSPLWNLHMWQPSEFLFLNILPHTLQVTKPCLFLCMSRMCRERACHDSCWWQYGQVFFWLPPAPAAAPAPPSLSISGGGGGGVPDGLSGFRLGKPPCYGGKGKRKEKLNEPKMNLGKTNQAHF